MLPIVSSAGNSPTHSHTLTTLTTALINILNNKPVKMYCTHMYIHVHCEWGHYGVCTYCLKQVWGKNTHEDQNYKTSDVSRQLSFLTKQERKTRHFVVEVSSMGTLQAHTYKIAAYTFHLRNCTTLHVWNIFQTF